MGVVLGDTHQAAIANDIGEKDRRQSSFEVDAFHSVTSFSLLQTDISRFPVAARIAASSILGNGKSVSCHQNIREHPLRHGDFGYREHNVAAGAGDFGADLGQLRQP